MKKTITNEQFEDALKNEDYAKIMTKASIPFFSTLSKDEIETCKMNALWKALASFDENYKVKFTSFLYNGVYLECKAQCNFINRIRKKPPGSRRKNYLNNDSIADLELNEELDSIKDGDIIKDHFVKNMTIAEISEKIGISRTTVTLKKKKALERLAHRNL